MVSPSNRWRRYDRVRLPGGFIVVGYAFCSLNPIYGQGMTVAALQALALRGCLSNGQQDLQRRFFRAAAKPTRLACQMAVGGGALPVNKTARRYRQHCDLFETWTIPVIFPSSFATLATRLGRCHRKVSHRKRTRLLDVKPTSRHSG